MTRKSGAQRRAGRGRMVPARAQSGSSVSMRVINPPSIPSAVIVKRRYRFVASAATASGGTNVSTDGLLGVMGVMAATSTTAFKLFRAARIRQVEIWAPSSGTVSGFPNGTVELKWSDDDTNSPGLQFSATSLSTGVPAHIKATPPPNSSAAFWFNTTTGENMFTITCPAQSIIDVTMEGIMNDDLVAIATAGVTSKIAGVVYYEPLDYTANNFQPVALPSAR